VTDKIRVFIDRNSPQKYCPRSLFSARDCRLETTWRQAMCSPCMHVRAERSAQICFLDSPSPFTPAYEPVNPCTCCRTDDRRHPEQP
jgi:hypothetical protein